MENSNDNINIINSLTEDEKEQVKKILMQIHDTGKSNQLIDLLKIH